MTDEYSKVAATRISRFKFADIEKPTFIKLYWINSISAQAGGELIGRKRHEHTFFEAHYILRGKHSFLDGAGKETELCRGEAIIFSPGEKHTVTKLSGDMLRLSIAFLPERNSALYRSLSARGNASFRLGENICRHIELLFDEAKKSDIFSESLMNCYALEIMFESFRLLGVSGTDIELAKSYEVNGESIMIAKAKQYISDNIEKKLTCGEVAEYCHFNAKYISRVFKAQTGASLLEYIHAEKLKLAERLLRNSELSLREISNKLGFANEYHFNSFFGKHAGISPGRFRELHK